jgi:pectinesterase
MKTLPLFVAIVCMSTVAIGAPVALPFAPDVIVASDGSGDFRSIHAAVQSIPATNRERRIIFVKDGTYTEKVRVDAPFVSLVGESRSGTRIEFAQAATAFDARTDKIGRAVLNLSATASDFVLQNLTVRNTQGEIGPHAFAVYGLADRTVITDCDILSSGADTLSLWRGRAEDTPPNVSANPSGPAASAWRKGGRYYHARLKIEGSVDFVCPRGWCYIVDSEIIQVNPRATAAVWHDGSRDPDQKFTLQRCRFDGPPNWYLARWHHDAQFFFVDCTFSATLRDRAPYRVIYPLDGGPPSEADRQKNAQNDRSNVLGNRVYYADCHKDGGDYAWHRDNLATAPGAPKRDDITAAWTFAQSWNPERSDAPRVNAVRIASTEIEIEFTEDVTVKGRPRLVSSAGQAGEYLSGSGSTTLKFQRPAGSGDAAALDLAAGAIVANEAGAALRIVRTEELRLALSR